MKRNKFERKEINLNEKKWIWMKRSEFKLEEMNLNEKKK